MQYFKRRFKTGRFVIFITLVAGLIVFMSFGGFAQTSTTPAGVVDSNKIKVGTFANVGLTSQYLWRGTMLDNKPNIQPILGLAIGNFEVGTFGSLSILNNYYEVDLYASYKYKFIKLTVTDFYIDLNDVETNPNYFYYSTNFSDTTQYSISRHHIVCDLSIGGTEKIPIKLTASTILCSGWDVDSLNKAKYTTYVEVRYLGKNFELFIGGLSGTDYFYANEFRGLSYDIENKNKFAIVNVGAVYNYKIKDVPTYVQICANPQMEKAYLTFGVTF